MIAICPECQAAKCGNCDGSALDEVNDQIVRCQCPSLYHVDARVLLLELLRRGALTRVEDGDPEGTWHYESERWAGR